MQTIRLPRPAVRPAVCIRVPARAAWILALALGGAAAARAEEPPAVPVDPGAGTSVTALAELPYWPIGFAAKTLGAPKPDREGRARASVMAWVPTGATRLRALLIIPNNSDSKDFGQHGNLREAAARHEMAIVYLRDGDIPHVQGILDELAAGTGIAEFRHAPWIPFGKSSRGKFPILMAWQNPTRTIASLSYHAETPTWPPDDAAKVGGQTILHVNANGETEWGGTWFVHVRPSLLNYRANSRWLPHIVAAKGVDHGDYPDASGSEGWGKAFAGRVTRIRVWDYLSVYVDKALELRVPKDRYATEGPVELKQVDETTGYLIDPFAIEDLFRQPHYPLVEKDGLYVVGNTDESPTSGFVAVAPAADYTPAEGVPVVAPELGKSPSAWLATEGLRFAMQKDPMTDLGGLDALRPSPGDTVKIDDVEATFRPLAPQGVAARGGISLQGLKKWGQSLTLAGYTVLDVPAPMRAKLHAPFSVAGRLRVVINGVPVDHKQVVEFQKGLYPMLVVLRLSGPNWGAIDPHFLEVTDAEVAQARELTAEQERRKAEQAAILAQGVKKAVPPVRRYADVPEAERRKMLWVADREQAEAWFTLHAIHGQTFDVP